MGRKRVEGLLHFHSAVGLCLMSDLSPLYELSLLLSRIHKNTAIPSSVPLHSSLSFFFYIYHDFRHLLIID